MIVALQYLRDWFASVLPWLVAIAFGSLATCFGPPWWRVFAHLVFFSGLLLALGCSIGIRLERWRTRYEVQREIERGAGTVMQLSRLELELIVEKCAELARECQVERAAAGLHAYNSPRVENYWRWHAEVMGRENLRARALHDHHAQRRGAS